MKSSLTVVEPDARNKHDQFTSQTPRWAFLVATALHAGWVKAAPGTCGAAIGIFLWLAAVKSVLPSWQIPTAIGAALLVTAIGIPASSLVARAAGEDDPFYVIVDEVAGQLFTLIGCPINWSAVVVGFVLFRIFDIAKPFPLRRLERLREGYGIVMDDVGAGLYALAVLQALIYFGILR